MKTKKLLLITGLGIFSSSVFAGPATHSISLNNRSNQNIYVWVTQAVNVMGPDSSRPPYLALVIKPNTNHIQLNYTYTDTAWNNQTVFSLAFCRTVGEDCISAVGQHSVVSMIPVPDTTAWQVPRNSAQSGMLVSLPPNRALPIQDNVASLQGAVWN